MKKIILITIAIILANSTFAQDMSTSVAGLYPLANSGRVTDNFNEGWRFLLGDAEGAEAVFFDDSSWEVVCAPHTARLEPSEASGCRTYQGICWYRKRFPAPEGLFAPDGHAVKNVRIEFDGVFMNSTVYVNGHDVGTRLLQKSAHLTLNG